MEGVCIFSRIETAAGAGEHRQSARDLCADRVDGTDVEAVGVVEQVPAELLVPVQNGAGEFSGLGLKGVLTWGWFRGSCGKLGQDFGLCGRFGERGRLSCGGEVGKHAVAHLGGGLVGEGDGEDLLGLLHGVVGKQLEQALDEQAGLA